MLLRLSRYLASDWLKLTARTTPTYWSTNWRWKRKTHPSGELQLIWFVVRCVLPTTVWTAENLHPSVSMCKQESHQPKNQPPVCNPQSRLHERGCGQGEWVSVLCCIEQNAMVTFCQPLLSLVHPLQVWSGARWESCELTKGEKSQGRRHDLQRGITPSFTTPNVGLCVRMLQRETRGVRRCQEGGDGGVCAAKVRRVKWISSWTKGCKWWISWICLR